ncbi:MAG: hypothetical protein HFI01_09625 [Lachnospiraceae bacterium]|nr:hypothetical protein [Lachnospiraceae bacterium]MCI9343218.1 hypothetical protein [Lachnospiraceae bacterium]GFH88912.1 hypothetical protein IMSAGC002_00150 [Lachnospiraceae bacterium]
MVTKMKNGKTLGIMLAIANAVLAIVSVVLYIGTDRKEPTFEFTETNVIYEEGMEESRLLEGIMAYDNVDGDLTDKIVVEKRIENQEQNSVVIFYAVSDSAGNVAKCSREFTAIYRIETEETDNQELQDGPLVQSGVWSVLEGGGTGGNSLADESVKGDGKETDGQDLDAGEAGEDESAGEEENEDGLEEEEGIEETEQQEQGQERDAEQQEQTPERDDGQQGQTPERDTQAMRNRPDPEAPVLELRVSEVTTQVGVAPAWVNVIGTLSDDKDNYETLFGNLEISKYNINQAGTYQVKVSTRDSDGNKSGEAPLTIIVR